MEEEAKRRTLLRYIHAVKAAASLGLDDESHKNMTAAVGRPGRGIIQVRRWGRYSMFLALLWSCLVVDRPCFSGQRSSRYVSGGGGSEMST